VPDAFSQKTDKDKLKLQPIRNRQRLLFSFLGFCYSWNSPEGKAIPMLNHNPTWLAPLIVAPYMLAALVNVHNTGGTRYFIVQDGEVVGTAVLKVHKDALAVRSTSVLPTKRKHGIGYFVLSEAEKYAKQLGLGCLEVEILKDNVPSLRLCFKYGFKVHAKGRMAVALRKQV
jgi:RimJ/RimL family protein N-acetyltransferase